MAVGEGIAAALVVGRPDSAAMESRGSSGTLPRNGAPISAAIFSAPPEVGAKISEVVAQVGQEKPDMFSTTPCNDGGGPTDRR